MRMKMTRPASYTSRLRALILTADKFEDTEVLVPYFRLLEAGARVDIAAPARTWIGGEHHYALAPDLAIEAVDPEQYDLLIVPGGFPDGAPATVRDLPRAQAIARSFFERGKPIASICHGPWLLAASGAIRGRTLTSFWHDGVPESITAAGATWQDADVVVDGNLVTSRWPPDLPVFTRAMIAAADAYLERGAAASL